VQLLARSPSPTGFYDADVKGGDPVTARAPVSAARSTGSLAMACALLSWKILAGSPVIVVQLTGHDSLKRLGVTLIAANAPDQFLEDTPTAKLIRQVLGAVADFEKSSLVAKLRGARDRKRAKFGKCEGRKSYSESRPELVAATKALCTDGMSYRKISAELAAQGFVTSTGKAFAVSEIQVMLRQ
jgi:hypothetical protein